MRILWIGQKPGSDGGEEVVDRKLKAAITARGHEIVDLHAQPVSRAMEVFNLARGLPYYRHRFHSRRNIDAVRRIPRDFDVAVASWEPFDRLALQSPIPVVLLLHNVTSSAIRSIFPGHPLARFLAARGERSERRIYSDRRLRAIATLSLLEQRCVARVSGSVPVIYTPPGMPSRMPLDAQAEVRAELLISGSYGWFPKRRDVRAFAEAYSALGDRLPVIATGLPDDAAQLLRPTPAESVEYGSAMRFGVITDRFVSGHKLKATYYLANNAIVLSLADIRPEFASIPDHEFFVRHISDVRDISRHVAEVSRCDPREVRERFTEFKRRCAETFSWQTSAERLLNAISIATTSQSPCPSGREGQSLECVY